jgi:hypothetical protein
MSLIDIAKKLLNAKTSPARAAVEKALADSRAELIRAETTLLELRNGRHAVLLNSSDAEAAEHDAAIAREERAKDRAAALIGELETRLSQIAATEQRDMIDAERKAAEEQIAAAIRALEKYQAVAEELRALIATVDAGEKAARDFNGRHGDETPIIGPESRVRWIAPTPRKELRRERVELWTNEGGQPIGEDRISRITKRGASHGSIITAGGNRNEVTLRPFDRVSFVPAFRGAAPAPLSHSVVLPGLRADSPHILDAERQLAHPTAGVGAVETELVPVGELGARAVA